MAKRAAAGSKAEQIAQQLLERIIAARLVPGSNVATEAELLEQFRVSRPTLRESLKLLQAQGVLQLRPGPGGGILVGDPGVETLAHGLSVFLSLKGVPFESVLRARETIEPALAAEAALNGTDEDFSDMEASIARMKTLKSGNQTQFLSENRLFHGVVARASGNTVLETFWSTISLIGSGEHHGIRYSSGNQTHVVNAHQRILDACRRRDARAAAAAMSEHVSGLENLVRVRFQHLLKHPTRVLARRGHKAA